MAGDIPDPTRSHDAEIHKKTKKGSKGDIHGILLNRYGEPKSSNSSVPYDSKVAAFWETSNKLLGNGGTQEARIADSNAPPSAHEILRSADLSRLSLLKGLGDSNSRVERTLQTAHEAIRTLDRIQEKRRKIDANDALERFYPNDTPQMRKSKIRENVKRALKLLEEFDKLTREARGGKLYQQFCKSNHVDEEKHERSKQQSFKLIEHQIGHRTRDYIIKKMRSSSDRLPIDHEEHEARVRETWQLLDYYRKFISDTKGSFATRMRNGEDIDENELTTMALARFVFVNDYVNRRLKVGQNLTH